MASFAIVTKASSAIGFGHLTRCEALRNALLENGHQAILILNNTDVTRALVGTENVHFSDECSLVDWPTADVCVLDIYGFPHWFVEELKNYYSQVICFDDYRFDVPAGVSAVINGNIYAKPEHYPKSVKAFAGPQYFLLRQDLGVDGSTDQRENIFVCMGGSDPEGQTDRILRILTEISTKSIDAVFGPGFEDDRSVEFWGEKKIVTVHRNPSDIGQLMGRAEYAVCGAGTMLYELSYMGTPAACLSLIDHQRLVAESFADHHAALNLGKFSETTSTALTMNLARFDQDKKQRDSIKHRARQMIDGSGASRLVRDLSTWLGIEM